MKNGKQAILQEMLNLLFMMMLAKHLFSDFLLKYGIKTRKSIKPYAV
jgi:hypothetical protein